MESIIDDVEKIEIDNGNNCSSASLIKATILIEVPSKEENSVSEPLQDQDDVIVAESIDPTKVNTDHLDEICSSTDILYTNSEENNSDNDSWNNYCKLLDMLDSTFNWDSNSEGDADSGLKFYNIFEDIGNLTKIEKELELLYRPFTCLMDANCRFNLCELCLLIIDSHYEPGCHPSVSIKTTFPLAKVKVYEGGKMISSALTADSARDAILSVIQMVQALNIKAEINFLRHNIVNASFCMPFKVDLEMLAELHSEQVSFNIKKRPFLIYSIEGTQLRFVVFTSGYVMVLHSSKHSETRAAIAGFLPILSDFRNGFLTEEEQKNLVFGDITYKLLWERKFEDDRDGLLLCD
ncbi:uncharacterized protein Trf4 [Drosophila tropicalis]|uniref:uncharacterized protein Trf4 n=1 Tax=Drosophila tropicalis TaxID=46794 RepID=UPI0035ABF416